MRGVVKRNVVGFDQTGYWSGRETRYLVLTPSLLLIYYSEVVSGRSSLIIYRKCAVTSLRCLAAGK